MGKYIDAELLRKEIETLKDEYTGIAIDSQRGWVNANFVIDDLERLQSQIDSLQQEQPDKESLNKSQQEFVNIVTERMLKEGPIPTLKGKQKAEFEKEFNRFKQITGMINFPAHMEIYKKIILWFMAWGADNLPNLNKVANPDELDFQQEPPRTRLIQVKCLYPHDESWQKNKVYTCEVWHHGDLNRDFWDVYYDYENNPKYVQFPSIQMLNEEFAIVKQEQPEVDLEKEIKNYLATECAEDDEPSVSEIARHFYELGLKSK